MGLLTQIFSEHRPRRIALILDADGFVQRVVTDDPSIRVFTIDDRVPDDRVYELTVGVHRVSPDNYDAAVGIGDVHHLGDKPNQEQAARALIDRDGEARPSLTIVPTGQEDEQS